MNPSRAYRFLLPAILVCYAGARVLQVITGPTPRLSLVAPDVLSAAAFALVDGSRRYGRRGILVFAAICLAVGNVVENIGVATGFPFGHYRFLEVMGPRFLSVPILLGLAYVGMAYVSWVVARILMRSSNGSGKLGLIALPAVASLVMVSWDVAQDPVWSTFLHAWVWRDGGSWFGVPLSNYAGWYGTVFTIYLLFAIYLKRAGVMEASASNCPAVAFYALCAAGNVAQIWVPHASSVMADATGRRWPVTDILRASALVSVFLMGTFVLLAVGRLRPRAKD